ncbi:MAG: flippase-like domain-containing protein, partial [Verrucomicrobia bacterium]|nr:flippase-like domain-containing protein [Verrucomicrobiota bacterium]
MKKALITTLQILVSISILAWVFRDPRKNAEMLQALRLADARWLLAALAVTASAPVCATLRWGLLLRAQNIVLPWLRVLEIFFVGNFFNLFGLGATGGDVVKIFYLLREPAAAGRKTTALLTVVMDRLLGLLGLVIIACVFIPLRFSWLTQTKTSAGWLSAFLLILASAIGGIVVTAVVAYFNLADRLPARLPGRAGIVQMSTALRQYGRAWRTTLCCLAISLPGHTALFGTVYYGARAFHLTAPSLLDLCTLMPIANTIISVPVSVSGMGVREGIFRQLLGDLCGVSEVNATLLAEVQ